jgi:ribulose-5-phosphate 4-epimerase/fuculose-1-phosphate aldolase
MTAIVLPNAQACQDAIARAVRICNMADVMDWNGHVSMRDPDAPSTIWINSRNASRSTIRKRDIVPFDLDAGCPIGDVDEPPSEYHIHREIYRVRPDVAGIVHSHPNYIVTLGHALLPVTGNLQREYWVVAVDKFWNNNEETALRAGALDELD